MCHIPVIKNGWVSLPATVDSTFSLWYMEEMFIRLLIMVNLGLWRITILETGMQYLPQEAVNMCSLSNLTVIFTRPPIMDKPGLWLSIVMRI